MKKYIYIIIIVLIISVNLNAQEINLEIDLEDPNLDNIEMDTDRLKEFVDDIKPTTQTNYVVQFDIPLPGVGNQTITIDTMPDSGSVLDDLRQKGLLFLKLLVVIWFVHRVYEALSRW